MVKIARAKVPRRKTTVIRKKSKLQKRADTSSDEASVDDYGPLSDKLTTDIHLSDSEQNGGQKNDAPSDIDSDDSDYELQIALKEGLLQNNGLNIIQEQPKQKINKRKEMEEKFEQFHKKRKFIEALAVTFPSELSYTGAVDSDFEREAAFMKQAQNAVATALPKLQALKVPIFRPDDYFAEMAKSDTHMQKVRHYILDIQKDKEKREASRRLREEKRFALKVQGAAEQRKQKEKRKLLEAVKKHRKGMKGQLEQMLNNNSTHNLDDDEDTGKGKFKKQPGGKFGKMSRASRDKKFGFGGKKKRSKQNDRASFEDPFSKGKKPQQKFAGKNNKRHGRSR